VDERAAHEKVNSIVRSSSEGRRKRPASQNVVRAFDDPRRSRRPHFPLFPMFEDAMTESIPLVKVRHFVALLDAVFAFTKQIFRAGDVGAEEMSQIYALF
jgi:hypothetical protein